jgi:Rrf2 family protein
MKLGAGVEWGIHCCLTLAWLEREGPVPIGRLAQWFDLPPEYLKKRLQLLARAGILESAPGVHGGFSLGRRPERITLMDVVVALEGSAAAFQCMEIRQRGVGGRDAEFTGDCSVKIAMSRAELAWRRELAAQSIADLMAAAPAASAERTRRRYADLASG